MKTNKLFCALVAGLLFLVPATATYASPVPDGSEQQLNCRGTIIDETGEPVIGASVLVEGTTTGTVTDFDGNFAIPNVAKGSNLVISYMGYATQTVMWNGQSINLTMKEDSEILEEVVVTGYGGKQKRGAVTTAITKMDDRVLETAAVSNVGSGLQGSVTGLRVTQVSGQPGADPVITLRGGASINGGSDGALIVVDGIIRDGMGDINPADIESMQVLKDAAATAIYGARANGGVILIQTKSGKAGKATVNFKMKLGSNFARMGYDMLNAEDYIYYNRLGYNRYAQVSGATNLEGQTGYGVNNQMCDIRFLTDENKNLLSEGWKQMTDPVTGNQLIYGDYTGVLDNACFQQASLTQDYYVSVAGGTDKSTVFASLGYYDEDGMIKGTGYKRFNGSLNASYQVLPILKLRAGATYSYSSKDQLWIGEYEYFYRARSQRPTWNPYNADGTPASGWSTSDGNPEYYRERLTNTNSTRKGTYNIGLDLDIVPEKLTFTANASLYNYDYQKDAFNKSYQTQTSGTPNTTRGASATISKFRNIQTNGTLDYNDTFADKHHLDVMLGYEYFDHSSYYLYAATENSPTDDVTTMNAGATRTSTTSSKSQYRIWSVFGRVNYDYESKYLLSLTARADGISKLKDNRWGFFPGVSAGYNMAQEDFWLNSRISNVWTTFKPRISYGVNGNVNGIGDFDIYGVYKQIGAGAYDGQTAYYNSTLINTALRWEQSRSFEVGLDLGFLNNRVALILDYYNRTTSDLLTDISLPAYMGFSSMKTNLGALRNQGFEMELTANLINKGGFRWDLTANITTVGNKILRLPDSDKPNNQIGGYEVADGNGGTKWIGGYAEGGTLGDIVAYTQEYIITDVNNDPNVYNRVDEIAKLYGPGKAAEYAGQPGWKPIENGDVCWKDIDGNGIINSLDKEVIGNMFPNVTGGFSTTLAYKGVSLYARFDYALGHTIYNDLKARTMGQYQGQFNGITTIKEMSNPEKGEYTDYPAYSYADQLNKKNICRESTDAWNINGHSSKFYERGDYLALRELTLNWDLPGKWTSKMKMQKMSLYVTGQNLFYATQYSGASPEPKLDSYYQGIDLGRYPTPRQLIFGLNVTF